MVCMDNNQYKTLYMNIRRKTREYNVVDGADKCGKGEMLHSFSWAAEASLLPFRRNIF